MKIVAFALAAGVGLALAAPFAAPANAQAPKDTGSMAFPAPKPSGEVGTTVTQPRGPTDTGNMAYPAPKASGTIGGGAASSAPDTGNMAYPAPRPTGQLGTTSTKQ